MKLLRSLSYVATLLAFLLIFAGCKSNSATTAHYRGDSLYGDSDHRNGAGKSDGKPGRPGKPAMPSSSAAEVYARAKQISDPLQRALVEEAVDWLGVPYQWGGSSRDGADCSGMVLGVYLNVCGLKMPRTANDMSQWCKSVGRDALRPGDLVFFSQDGERVSHVGMYVGDNEMIHASSSRGVTVSPLSQDYWVKNFYGCGRVDQAMQAWKSNDVTAKKGKKDKEGKKPLKTPVPEVRPDETPIMAAKPAPAETAKSQNKNATMAASTREIDLLDLIINEKVDSIFN